MAVSFQCMTKFTTNKKQNKKIPKKIYAFNLKHKGPWNSIAIWSARKVYCLTSHHTKPKYQMDKLLDKISKGISESV